MNKNEIVIDYMSYNVKPDKLPYDPSEFKASFIPNYDKMCTGGDGETYHWGNKVTDKTKVIYTGIACARLFNEISPSEFIEYQLIAGASFTRIDIALTEYLVDEHPYTTNEVLEAYNTDLIDSTHAIYGCKVIADSKLAPETLVIGRWGERGKHGIVRAYDKSLELDIGRYLINRIEVEDKRDKAHVSARRIANGDSLQSVFKSRFDIKEERFQKMLDNAEKATSRPPSVEDENLATYKDESFRAWGWLLGTVAQALGKRIALDHKHGIDCTERQNEFWNSVNDAYNKNIS